MVKTRNFLKSMGLASGDLYDLPTSEKRFPDGAQYRFEVPGIQGPATMKAVLESAEGKGLTLHRITQTKGIMLLSDEEIQKMVELAKKHGVELILAVGPRATYDTGATVHTEEGVRAGYRLRGQEQIVRAIEDIKRAAGFGVRGILVYDEGLLWILGEMRKAGELPANLEFKVSAHCGHGNSCSARLMQNIGAGSFNPIRDIQLQMLSAIRHDIDIPIDIHTENPKSSGGFIRHYEVPEFVRIAAPVYLKTGGSVAQNHSWESTEADGVKRVKQVGLVERVIREYYPEAACSKNAPADLKIPE